MKIKAIAIDDKTMIIDSGLSRLVILTGSGEMPDFSQFIYKYDGRWTQCSAVLFQTKKGRDAIKIDLSGYTHVFRMHYGSGDRSWGGWNDRRPINAVYADAAATSNGGGCWLEIQVMKWGEDPITAEIDSYREELQ